MELEIAMPGEGIPAEEMGSEIPMPEELSTPKASEKALQALKELSDDDLIAELKARGFEIEQEELEEGQKTAEIPSYFDTAAAPIA